MTQEQIQEFEMWLPQVINELGPELNIPEEVSQSIANAQSVEEVDAILNEISQVEGGQEILSGLISAFDSMGNSQEQMMKIGGKLNYFVEKFGKGGKCCKKENGGEVKEDKCGGKVKKKKCCGGCKTIMAQKGGNTNDYKLEADNKNEKMETYGPITRHIAKHKNHNDTTITVRGIDGAFVNRAYPGPIDSETINYLRPAIWEKLNNDIDDAHYKWVSSKIDEDDRKMQKGGQTPIHPLAGDATPKVTLQDSLDAAWLANRGISRTPEEVARNRRAGFVTDSTSAMRNIAPDEQHLGWNHPKFIENYEKAREDRINSYYQKGGPIPEDTIDYKEKLIYGLPMEQYTMPVFEPSSEDANNGTTYERIVSIYPTLGPNGRKIILRKYSDGRIDKEDAYDLPKKQCGGFLQGKKK